MPAKNKPSATMQWWLDRRAVLEAQISSLKGKKAEQRKMDRLRNEIERISTVLAIMERERTSRRA